MQREIIGGSTDQSVVIRIIDSTDGTPETGVTFETSGLTLWYRRESGGKVTITPATLAAIDSAHSDGGIIHIGDGYYRLDPPDAAIASGVDGVMFGGAVTGMIVIGCYIQIVSEGASAAALQTVDDNVDTLISRLTAARAGYIDKLNVSGTVAHSDAAATYQADVSGIPTNPLLTNDARLDNLDAAVSSRSSHSAADVWSVTTRTLSSFGSLVSDIASAVWGAGTRTLTGFGTLIADIWSYATRTLTSAGSGGATAQDVWEYSDRQLTSFGSLVSSIASAVWTAVTRTLTAGTKDTEIDAILQDTGTTIPGQISGLNNLSAAEVNAACDQAIAEAGLATAAALAVVDANVDAILEDTGTVIPELLDAVSRFDPEVDELENGKSYAYMFRLMAAQLLGDQASGAFRNLANTKDRLVFVIDPEAETRTRVSMDGD